MTAFACLGLAIALTVYSNLVIKGEATRSGSLDGITAFVFAMAGRPLVWSAAIATAGATLAWLVAVRELPLVVAQPVMALVFVAVPLAAAFAFGEPLPIARVAGLGLIVAGVVLVVRA